LAEKTLNNLFEPTLTPVLRLRPLYLLRDGILHPLARLQKQNIQPVLFTSKRTATESTNLAALHEGNGRLTAIASEGAEVRPNELLANIGRRIAEDIPYLPTEFLSQGNFRLHIEGEAKHCYIHTDAQVSAHAVINTEAGPVVIDAAARIGAFCLLRGPLYIGARTQLDNCHVSNAIVGTDCRLGGEIADSVIGNYTNKHHEGFLGHSIVGDWVNLGAMTTTSDLKNNYGEVRLTFGTEKYAAGTIKFGSIIGDYAKTAIGTMLGTGSIVDLGANLFGLSHRSGYFRPFLWGETKIYDRNKFIEDAGRMMQRRKQAVTPALEKLLREI